MSSEHDYSVYGQYEQHKLCCYSGLLQTSRRERDCLFDRHLQFQYRRDFMYVLPDGIHDGVYCQYEQFRLRSRSRLLRCKRYV